jgi:hypothetical protein
MKQMALLFSHTLTEEQENEARERWGVTRFLPVPEELQSRWSQVPVEGPFPKEWMIPIVEWLEGHTQSGDLVLVQGEFGAVYFIVQWCYRNERIPLYATTVRINTEHVLPNGTTRITKIFSHVNFRVYPWYK